MAGVMMQAGGSGRCSTQSQTDLIKAPRRLVCKLVCETFTRQIEGPSSYQRFCVVGPAAEQLLDTRVCRQLDWKIVCGTLTRQLEGPSTDQRFCCGGASS